MSLSVQRKGALGDDVHRSFDPTSPTDLANKGVCFKNQVGRSRALNQSRPCLTSQLGKQVFGPSWKYAQLTLISYKHIAIRVRSVHHPAGELTSTVSEPSFSPEAEVHFSRRVARCKSGAMQGEGSEGLGCRGPRGGAGWGGVWGRWPQPTSEPPQH